MANWRKVRRITAYSLLGATVLSFGLWYYFGEGGVREANGIRDTYNRQKLEIAEREILKEELSTYLAAVERKDEAALELAARRYGLVGEDEYLWKVKTVPVDSVSH